MASFFFKNLKKQETMTKLFAIIALLLGLGFTNVDNRSQINPSETKESTTDSKILANGRVSVDAYSLTLVGKTWARTLLKGAEADMDEMKLYFPSKQFKTMMGKPREEWRTIRENRHYENRNDSRGDARCEYKYVAGDYYFNL